ncbi:MAG: hypothetical protein N2043_13175 [Ignavibacterium sp.]|nr:hypothetical protein [Ignavibacterium sp.]
MGILLRPSHNLSSKKAGWNVTSLDDIISNIDINVKDLGFWGKMISESNVKDAHSIIYSIPNPWASAYLYNFILTGGNFGADLLSVQTKLLDLLISVLYDYAFKKSVKLYEIKIDRNLNSSLSSLIPEFLKFGDKIYVFEDSSGSIIGGLSRKSLIWVSQLYDTNEENLKIIKEYDQFKVYLNDLKKNKEILDDDIYNTFWGLNYFKKILSELPENLRLEYIQPYNLIPQVSGDVYELNKKYFNDEIKTLVLTEKILNEDKEIIPGIIIDDKLKKEMLSIGRGTSIPKIDIKIDWVIVDKFIEKKFIQYETLNKYSENLPRRKEDVIKCLDVETGLLYPFKAELIEALKGKLELISFKNYLYRSGDKYAFNIKYSCGNAEALPISEMEVLSTSRVLAIWPPFKSEFVDNYIFDYSIVKKEDGNELRFFDLNGNEINSEINRFKNFNVHRLKNFPTYVVFKENDNGTTISGSLKVIETKKDNHKKEKVHIAIDFGTTRTNIAYKLGDEEPKLIDFIKSLPIVFASDDDLDIVNLRFLPVKWLEKVSWSLQGKNISFPIIPFLSIYRTWRHDYEKLAYEDGTFSTGSIFFNLPDERTNKSLLTSSYRELITNLKWGLGGGSNAEYRTNFLQQLLEMVLVEFEARGFEDINVYWTYPKAFSREEFLQLNQTWDALKQKFESKIKETKSNFSKITSIEE